MFGSGNHSLSSLKGLYYIKGILGCETMDYIDRKVSFRVSGLGHRV